MGIKSKTMAGLSPDPSSLNREDALYMAKLAEQAERYDDMVNYMRRIVDLKIPANKLSVEERNLLSVGYKNMMSVRRTAWRTVQQYHEKNQEDGNQEAASQDSKYSDHISQEVFALINEVVSEIVNVYVNGDNKCEEDKDGNIDSVFHYEICEQKREASDLAKEAFDTAIDHLDTLADDEYKDSTLIMQLLKDNLTLWKNNKQTGEEADDIQVEDVQ